MVEARLARQFSDERHIARGRQPAEFDREQEDQHDAEPEIRRRDAPQREQVGAIVPGGALLDRRDDAGGDADQEGDHDRHRGELHRHRQLLRDQVEHRHLDAERLAEVARQHALDPVDILHRDRLIEPVLLADLRDHVGIALLARHDQRRIAGQQMLQRKDQHRHEEQCRDQLQQALAEKVQHRCFQGPLWREGHREGLSAIARHCVRLCGWVERLHFSFNPTTRTSPSGICL